MTSSTVPSSAARSKALDVIHYEYTTKRFALEGPGVSYVFHVDETGELVHEHFGAPIQAADPSPPAPEAPRGWLTRLTSMQRELPDFGRGDFRIPAVRIKAASGHSVSHLRYTGHSIIAGKPALPGLPATYGTDESVQTLRVVLLDEISRVRVTVSYSLFPAHNAIARHTEFKNDGSEPVTIEDAASFSLDLPRSPYDMLQLSGDWSSERREIRRSVQPGTQGVQSREGYSGHEHNPFLALMSSGADERHGEVYGFSLVYSGSFNAQVEQDPFGRVRVVMGLNPIHLSWPLAPGETFVTPECVAVYSSQGLGTMSRHYHDLYKQHLSRSTWQHKLRPALINNWEATYFDFNADDIVRIAEKAHEAGVKLMVLDDGWFGTKYPRNNDRAGLGDWVVNPDKLPDGLTGLCKRVNALGMSFGVWVEPEMVNPSSELYDAHPDWVLHAGKYERTEKRNQLVLNLSLPDVQNHLITVLSQLLKSAPIAYVKWDNNRGMHELPSPTTPHAYMLGLYRVISTLTERFPHVLFEGCASGGGRFDPGMLYYWPQSWTSDNTDGLDRLTIQMGTTTVYPVSSMGGHVSAVPNHQNQRTTPLSFRAHVAMMCGSFGFELDLAQLPKSDLDQIPALVRLSEAIQAVVHHGDLYRLAKPQSSNWPACNFVSKDGTEVVVLAFQLQQKIILKPPPLRLEGLAPEARYRIVGESTEMSGITLMDRGLFLQFNGDYDSRVIRLERV